MCRLFLLLACLLACSCGPSDSVNSEAGGNEPVAGAPRPDHPLAAEIDKLRKELEDFAARAEAAPAEERKGAKREAWLGEFATVCKPIEGIEKGVADSGNEELKTYWAAQKEACKLAAKRVDVALGLTAENHALKARLDIKQLGDLLVCLQMIQTDERSRKKLRDAKYADKRGREFWEFAFRAKLIEYELLPKLVSLNSAQDTKASPDFIDAEEGKLDALHCSYTAPIVKELLHSMSAKGADRRILVCFNARNWNNYPDQGVLVLWSGGDLPVYMTAEEAKRDWGITAEEWADPAGKLFGKKAPFQHTYE